jgi:Flp pilus assembly protein TadD
LKPEASEKKKRREANAGPNASGIELSPGGTVRFWLTLIVLVAAITAAAQRNVGRCTIRIDVVYASGGHAPAQLRVQLSKGINGTIVAVGNTNTSGTAEFSDLDPGQYQAIVTGDGIETASSGNIEVNDWNIFQSQIIAVRRTPQNDSGQAPTVVAADLNVPAKAAKEYNHGNEEMKKRNWEKAIDRFNKAIEIYPQFSAAYNNLAVSYGQMGQKDKQRKTLEKVLTVNERCVPALLNLSDIDIREHNFVEANSLLDKALKVEPTNVEALSYLAQVNLAQGRYDLAIAAAHKAHGLSHQDYQTVHFTAASAFEHEGRIQDAITELQTFLQESPQGANADAARKAIAGLQNRSK